MDILKKLNYTKIILKKLYFKIQYEFISEKI